VLGLLAFLIVGLLQTAGCDQEARRVVYVPVEELEFADPLLRGCVREMAKTYHWPTAGRVESLHCTGSGDDAEIRRLEGIESLVNLEDLNVAHNRIQDLNPLLHLRKLIRLDLGFNDIERVTALPRALHIDLNHNRLGEIDWVKSTPSVRTILLEYNRIEDLTPLSELEWLVELRVSGNRIERLDGLQHATRLEFLDASSNRINSVEELRALSQLTMLQLADNQIGDVGPLADLVHLRTLDLSGNRIEDVSALAGLVNLKVLNVGNNPIRNLTGLIELGELHKLDIRGLPDPPCAQVHELVQVFGEDVVLTDSACG
jgi:Leucine-rich repeat (LRR) protein